MAAPLAVLGIGAGVMGIGSALGGIFGKKAADAQKRALDQMRANAQREYTQLANYGLEQSDEILTSFLVDRSSNIGDYRQTYESLIANFDAKYADVTSAYASGAQGMSAIWNTGMNDLEQQYRSGMQQAYTTAAGGREATIAAIRRATESSVARTAQRQALMGIGSTTFGQGQLTGIEQQGALQEGVVQEQYASQLSGIQAAMTSGLANISQARVRGATDLMGQQVAGMRQLGLGQLSATSGMRTDLMNQILSAGQQTAGTAAAMRTSSLDNYTRMQQARIGAVLGIQQQQAAQSGAGWAAASGAMGGIASGVGGSLMTAGILGGLGGAFGGAGAGAGAGAAAGAGGGFTLPPAPQIGSSPFAGFTF
jgi:hypothetical protein